MNEEMVFSAQGIGTLMMALQKSLVEQTDIVSILEELKWTLDENGKLKAVSIPVAHLNLEDKDA